MLTHKRTSCFTLTLLFLLFGLSESSYGLGSSREVECKTHPNHQHDEIGNAGCLIRVGPEKIVAVLNRKRKPRFSVPGGKKNRRETAQCTAHRETLEETGLQVTVGKNLAYFTKKNFYLFECAPEKPLKEDSIIEVPDHGKREIISIHILDPFETKKKQWRFPKTFKKIKKILRD